jgi:hypothetical protein
MAQFIRDLVDFIYQRAYEPKFIGGRFAVLNKLMVTVSNRIGTFHSNVESLVNFQVTGYKTQVFQHDTTTNYTGYNKKYMRDDGTFDPLMAFEDYSKNPMGKKLTKEESQSIIKSLITEDSHEEFIYNMLVSWYKAKLYKDSGSKDKILKITQSGFEDTHVKLNYFGEENAVHEIPLEEPYSSPVEATIAWRTFSNYWDYPYVLKYTAGSVQQSAFYYAHLFGRLGQSALNVDIPLVGIDTALLVLDPVGGEQHSVASFDLIPWDKPEILWQWTMDYVRLNRVEHAFAAAFEMLGSLSSQPMQTYHESIVWEDLRTEVVLAKFQPTRAKIRTNLEGEPYSESNEADEFLVNTASHPQQFLMDCAIYNYMFWTGLPALVHAASLDYGDWYDVFQGGHQYLSILQTPHAKAAVVSTLFDKDIPTNANSSAYIAYHLSDMDPRKARLKVKEPGYPEVLELKSVVPFVSGALLAGTVSSSLPLTHHLRQDNPVEFHKGGYTDETSALTLANAYRLFGYDVDVARAKQATIFSCYANVKDWFLAPQDFYSETLVDDRLSLVNVRIRQHKQDILPNYNSFRAAGVTVVSFSVPSLEAVFFDQRTRPLVTRLMLEPRSTKVEFKVKAGMAFLRQAIQVRPVARGSMPDFQVVRTKSAPQNPVAADRATTHIEIAAGAVPFASAVE